LIQMYSSIQGCFFSVSSSSFCLRPNRLQGLLLLLVWVNSSKPAAPTTGPDSLVQRHYCSFSWPLHGCIYIGFTPYVSCVYDLRGAWVCLYVYMLVVIYFFVFIICTCVSRFT
jgi:hypothetical protein